MARGYSTQYKHWAKPLIHFYDRNMRWMFETNYYGAKKGLNHPIFRLILTLFVMIFLKLGAV
jgi:hypothetical protein